MCSKSISYPNQNDFFRCDPIIFTELHTYRKCFSTISIRSLWWPFLKDASRDNWVTDLGIKHRGAALLVPGGETRQTDRQTDRWPTISGAAYLTPGVDCTWKAGPQANKTNLSQENQYPPTHLFHTWGTLSQEETVNTGQAFWTHSQLSPFMVALATSTSPFFLLPLGQAEAPRTWPPSAHHSPLGRGGR